MPTQILGNISVLQIQEGLIQSSYLAFKIDTFYKLSKKSTLTTNGTGVLDARTISII